MLHKPEGQSSIHDFRQLFVILWVLMMMNGDVSRLCGAGYDQARSSRSRRGMAKMKPEKEIKDSTIGTLIRAGLDSRRLSSFAPVHIQNAQTRA